VSLASVRSRLVAGRAVVTRVTFRSSESSTLPEPVSPSRQTRPASAAIRAALSRFGQAKSPVSGALRSSSDVRLFSVFVSSGRLSTADNYVIDPRLASRLTDALAPPGTPKARLSWPNKTLIESPGSLQLCR
jgi:hypothetical protein